MDLQASIAQSLDLLRRNVNAILARIIGAGSPIGLFTEIPTLNIPASVQLIQTSGYSTPGLGGGEYALLASAPAGGANAYTVQSADGSWWQLTGRTVTPFQFGAVHNTDCTAAVSAAFAYLSALTPDTNGNQGALYYPGGYRYGHQDVAPCSNVDVYGDGDSSQLYLVENAANTAHIFYANGLSRGTYYLRNWRPLNNISPGNTVVLTNAGDVANFAVGQLVLVTSTGYFSGGGNDRQPYYGLINKIIGISGTTLTLESPILDSITGAQIAKQNDFTGSAPPDQWCGNSTFRNMCFDLTTTPAGIQSVPFNISALYRCHLHNLTFLGSYGVLVVNGCCYTTVEDIRSYDMAHDSANTMRLLEIKTGSYASSFKNIFASTGATFTCATDAFVEFGEYAQHIWLDGIRFVGPGVSNTYTYAVGPSGSMGSDYLFKGVDFTMSLCQTFISNNGQGDTNYPNYTGHRFIDCSINSPNCYQTVRIVPNNIGIGTFIVDGVRSLQPNTNWSNAISLSGFNGFVDCSINNVQSDGYLVFEPPPGALTYSTDLTISNCLVRGIQNDETVDPASYVQPWQIPMRNIRRYRESNVTSVQAFEHLIYTMAETAGTTTVANVTFPAFSSSAFSWAWGDEIEFDIEFTLDYANTLKTVQLIDVGNNNNVLAQVAATASGTYTMKGILRYFTPGVYSSTITVEGGGSSPQVNFYGTQNSNVTGFQFQVTGNIVSPPDAVAFTKIRIRPKLMFGGGLGA